jgi:hypothetical protein
MTLRAVAPFVALVVLVDRALADTIHLQDGSVIQNVQVASEGLKDVAYRDGKTDKTVPAESVLAVEYEKKPKPFEDAEGLLATEDAEGARDAYDAYVEGALAKPVPAQFRWAPPLAAWRALELRAAMLDLEGVKAGAKRLIGSYPESRFVPLAYLAKARAELQSGQAPQVKETLGELGGLVSSKSLAKRWTLEARLLEVQADANLKPESRRNEFERVAAEARELPWLQARAQVFAGESLLAQAAANPGGAKQLRAQARQLFEKVAANPAAAPSDVAAAHAGLGETLFLLGADANDKAVLQEALLSLLRVVTLHRDAGEPVARSFFFAMRCFDLLPDPRRKAEMKRELLALFPGSSWAEQAKKY